MFADSVATPYFIHTSEFGHWGVCKWGFCHVGILLVGFLSCGDFVSGVLSCGDFVSGVLSCGDFVSGVLSCGDFVGISKWIVTGLLPWRKMPWLQGWLKAIRLKMDVLLSTSFTIGRAADNGAATQNCWRNRRLVCERKTYPVYGCRAGTKPIRYIVWRSRVDLKPTKMARLIFWMMWIRSSCSWRGIHVELLATVKEGKQMYNNEN